MKYTATLLATLLLTVAPAMVRAAELKVAYADVVQPDAGLLKSVSQLRTLAAPGSKKNIAKVEAFFAPEVKVFSRSLDPFQPWHPIDSLKGKYLDGVANAIVEQGEYEPDRPAPDYRLDAMKQIAGLISADATYGSLPEMPGAVCAPAAYEVDRKASLAFAKRFNLDAYSLRFFPQEVVFANNLKSKIGKTVPANTLIMFDYHPELPEGWGYYETAGGVKGYMKDRDDTLGLSQHHICFSRVAGRYKVSAIFGYGL
ncbi:hypothetical protein [Rhizobium sp.]